MYTNLRAQVRYAQREAALRGKTSASMILGIEAI